MTFFCLCEANMMSEWPPVSTAFQGCFMFHTGTFQSGFSSAVRGDIQGGEISDGPGRSSEMYGIVDLQLLLRSLGCNAAALGIPRSGWHLSSRCPALLCFPCSFIKAQVVWSPQPSSGSHAFGAEGQGAYSRQGAPDRVRALPWSAAARTPWYCMQWCSSQPQFSEEEPWCVEIPHVTGGSRATDPGGSGVRASLICPHAGASGLKLPSKSALCGWHAKLKRPLCGSCKVKHRTGSSWGLDMMSSLYNDHFIWWHLSETEFFIVFGKQVQFLLKDLLKSVLFKV